jgi:hypothetical protein
MNRPSHVCMHGCVISVKSGWRGLLRCRIRTEAEEEAVGNGAEAAEGVNNEGYQKGVTFVQCTNYHFTIYKSTGGADARGHETSLVLLHLDSSVQKIRP